MTGVGQASSGDSHPVHLYQIAYSDVTYAAIEPGYLILDNRENLRPDWFEYWPIRQFLLSETLDDNAFYGFFSPKFRTKTYLSHADVVAFVRTHSVKNDVMLFSPQPDMGAFFINVFEQAELFDPGSIAAYSSFLDHSGRSQPLGQIVMDSRHVVFSNYFVARPAFWREWLSLNEAMFAICEGPPGPLRDALLHPTSYADGVQRKVFLQERAASLLLATQSQWRCVAHNPYNMGWSMSRFREYPGEAVISDALKMAFRDHQYPHFLEAFIAVRERFRTGANG